MRFLITLLFALLLQNIKSAVPQAFTYQVIVIDQNGYVIKNRSVNFRSTITGGSANGPIVYAETQKVTTSPLGEAVVPIGNGIVFSGSFADIRWAEDDYFLKLEVDPRGGTAFIPSANTRLEAVPYALHTVDADNATSGGDASVANETIGTLMLSGSQLTIGEGTSATSAELTAVADQPLVLTPAGSISISGSYPAYTIKANNEPAGLTPGEGITVAGLAIVNSADLSVSDELQELHLKGDTLSISGGNSVIISQSLPSGVADFNPVNEIQFLSFDGDSLALSESNNILFQRPGASNYISGAGIDFTDDELSNTAPYSPLNLLAGAGIAIQTTESGQEISSTLSVPATNQPVPIEFQGHTLFLYPVANTLYGTRWGDTSIYCGATSPTDGKLNTQLIVSAHGSIKSAAKICDDLVGYGFSDWYLPSRLELNAIHEQSYLSAALNYSTSYFSSTEYSKKEAYRLGMNYGNNEYGPKLENIQVHCVRRDY